MNHGSCCIGTSSTQSNNGGRSQQSHPLMCTHYQEKVAVPTTASALEDAICSRLVHHDDTITDEANKADYPQAGDDDSFDADPVQIYMSDDAHLLRCRPPVMPSNGEEGSAPTIFGIIESAYSFGRKVENDDIPICVSLLEPRCNDSVCINGGVSQKSGCCCSHPRGNWERSDAALSTQSKEDGVDANNAQLYSYIMNGCIEDGTSALNSSNSHSQSHASVKIVDLTKIQDHRRTISSKGDVYPCFDTPGKVFHLLRSVLNGGERGLHTSSPWNGYYDSTTATDSESESEAADQVVAVLVNSPNTSQSFDSANANKQFWENIEREEIHELLDFRVGDAAPSYFLHSTSLIAGGKQCASEILEDLQQDATTTRSIEKEEKTDDNCTKSSNNALLFVYRRLSPRDVLSRYCLDNERTHVGCLWETYFEEADESEEETGIIIQQPPTQPKPIMKHRMVSPPYQSHAHEYPGLLDTLINSIDAIRAEAQKIPQWTAWPEQNHYADNSWNVFPLCYTFPANDITQRKFIEKTCAFVPETTRLLQTLGPTLRTALFSRLDPGARLGAHTGWADLANHVLRVHIPLVVPGGKSCSKANDSFNTGLCGTWVDGCVETHEEGHIICFDDSKVHRAFNYSDEERIVLIVDLLRPTGLPMGTATGGHSDELDAFISAF